MKKSNQIHFGKIFKKLFILGIFFMGLNANSQENSQITIGKKETIHSKILGENREIWIHIPESYQLYKSRYPVVYLLDGDAHFNSAVAITDFLHNSSNLIPEMIIVGVLNTDRTRDMTPTHIEEALPYLGREAVKTSGGAANFFSFIEKELMPHIEKNYPTAPYKIFIGHSLGGLLAIDGLVNHSDLFNAYVSIDPSLWWDNGKLVKEMAKSMPKQKFNNTTLYLACANTLGKGMDYQTVRKDNTFSSQHIRAILDANDIFSDAKNNKLKYGFKYYSDDNHGSVPMIAEYDAFRFIFDFYKMDLTDDERANWTKEIITRLEKHYEDISKKLGYTVYLPEEVVNAKAYNLLNQKKFEEAEYLFRLNIRNYPESANVYDSMGDCNFARGKRDKAIENYKKAILLSPNFEESKAKLEALLKN